MRPNTLTGHPLFRAAALAFVVALLEPSLGWSDMEQPLLRFIQLNDQHVESPPPAYALANEKLEYLVDALNAETYFPLPDFVVGVGDMVHNATTADFDTLMPILNELNCDFYPVVGNHEDNQQEGDPVALAPYRAAFGTGLENYAIQVGGIQFLMVDDSGAPWSNTQPIGIYRDQWVHDQLEATPGVPTIICAHIPLVPVREQSVLAQSFGFSSYYAQDATLLGTVEDHADQVIAVLSGHVHLSGTVERNNVHHIVPSGTGSYPCDFAYYEVFSDHMSVQMITLPEELRTPETDIHGPPRWTIAYTDATHPTHELYMSGNPWERSFDISFASGPVPAKSGFNSASGIADPSPLAPGDLHGQGGTGSGWTRPWTRYKPDVFVSGTATAQTTTKFEGDQAVEANSGGTTSTESAYGRTFVPHTANLVLFEFAVNIGDSAADELYIYLSDFMDFSAGMSNGDAGVLNIQKNTQAIRLYTGGVWQTTKWGSGAIALNTWYTIGMLCDLDAKTCKVSLNGDYDVARAFRDPVISEIDGIIWVSYKDTVYFDDFSVTPTIPGDANADGKVDAADAAVLADNWGQSGGWAEGDFDEDGIVGPADAAILAANWGYATSESTTVPEPSLLVMLLISAAMLLVRRRELSFLRIQQTTPLRGRSRALLLRNS